MKISIFCFSDRVRTTTNVIFMMFTTVVCNKHCPQADSFSRGQEEDDSQIKESLLLKLSNIKHPNGDTSICETQPDALENNDHNLITADTPKR